MLTLSAILALLKRIPWWLYVGVVAAAALWWLIADDRHYRALSASQAVTIAQVKDAQAKATAAAQAAHDAQEQRYKDLANAADQNHAAQTASADDAVARYIASHRVPVCPSAGRAGGGSIAGAARGDTSVPASMPSDPVVLSSNDVQACAGAVTYSLAARDWALSLNP